MTVRTTTERNFRRARVKPGRRAPSRIRISRAFVRRTLSLALLVFGAYQGIAFVLTTPLLSIQRIAVRGNVRLSSGQVQALVDDLRGTNILTADLEAFRRRLTGAPWIGNVALRRVLPSTIEVLVSERRPIGLGRLRDELYLVDETGTIIDQFGPQYAEFDLPIIDGLAAGKGRDRDAIDPARAELAARVIASVGRSRTVSPRLSQLDVSDPENVVVLLDGDPALLHLGREAFLERIQSYLEVSGALRDRVAEAVSDPVAEIDYVDLRFGRHMYARPATGARKATGRGTRLPAARRF